VDNKLPGPHCVFDASLGRKASAGLVWLRARASVTVDDNDDEDDDEDDKLSSRLGFWTVWLRTLMVGLLACWLKKGSLPPV
jgi:hypothetical protein